MLIAGVVFFFGMLTYIIIEREKGLIFNIYREKSLQTANIISQDLILAMLNKNPDEVSDNIRTFNRVEDIRVGVVGPKGAPAFNTDIVVPEKIFLSHKETHIKIDDDLVFYKPLDNDRMCQGCHGTRDNTRGMIIVKTSMKKAQAQINDTAKRLMIFALLIGFISEIFLIVFMRKVILIPLEELNRGASILKSGRLDHRIDIKRNDEIGELVTCFNDMAAGLEKYQSTLESEVRHRTNDLRFIAELAQEVFKGDISLEEIIDRCLNVITVPMGYRYAAVCLIDRETGLFLQEFKTGMDEGLCRLEISISGTHPFAEAIRAARPAIKNSADINLPPSLGTVAIVPLLSHQRKKCNEINLCTLESCPAYNCRDERCWLISETLCRSPQAVAGKDKIYGCLHCDVFPVLGVLIAGMEGEITGSSMYPLEILASEITSALENQKFIKSKKEDINSLIRLHDISVEKIQSLNIHRLTKSIVSSATDFANMDAAILWLSGNGKKLYLEDVSFSADRELLPDSIDIADSFVGRAVLEERPIETIKLDDMKCLDSFVRKNSYLYTATIPLKFKGTTYGCLTLLRKRDFFMTDSEKAIIQLFASQAAAAINSAKTYNDLKTEKDFSDAVFSNMSMGVMVLDGDDRIVRLNLAGSEILRLNYNEVKGRQLQEVVPQASDFLVINSEIGREVDIRMDEGVIPIGFSNSALLDINLEKDGTVIVFRDLILIKKLQAEVKRKQHFEAMGKVVAGVAHEIRNPLFGISSIVQILEREIRTEQHQVLLKAMLKEIYRMKNLVEELLLYSRPSKLDITEIDFNVFLDKIRHYINAKKDTLQLRLDIHNPSVLKADIDKMTQVFLNIIDNAIGAGSSEIDITYKPISGMSVISIKDNGIGIKKDAMERIFDPFFTTKKEGTGLGLSICRKIIEDHGGDIDVHSAEGTGTTVFLSLPF